MTLHDRFARAIGECPIIAILRGITPVEVVDVADALIRAGVRIIEIPLNSPDAMVSISRLRDCVDRNVLFGAGTVLTVEQARQVAEIGAELCISPNTNPAVIECALSSGMLPIPGFATPTEAFSAIAAGARHLKVFPAHQVGIVGIKALSAVLPAGVSLVAVGGVGASDAVDYLQAGCSAVGAGANLYSPGIDASEVEARARALRWSILRD